MENNLIDSKKSELLQRVSEYENAVSQDVFEIKAEAKSIIQNVLLIGGAFLFSYYVVKQLVSRKQKRASEGTDQGQVVVSNSERSTSLLVNLIFSHMATFLISIAKQKLLSFLDQLNLRNENTDDADTKP